MAFNMKRPIIKGTPLHKASIAKAKTDSIVAQTRTAGDPSLVDAGRALGRSYIPEAIDFSKDGLIDFGDVEAREGVEARKKKGKKKVKVKEKYDDSGLVNPDTQGGDYNFDINYSEEEKKEEKKKEEKRDKSGDKKATKIKPTKPGESKGKKRKAPDLETRDMLYGDTESADSEYVAPYVEEAEDEDVIEDAGLDNEPDMSNVESGNANNRGYKNWKVREEERNIAEAEALKARMDAEQEKRENDPLTKNILDQSDMPQPNYTPEYRDIKNASKTPRKGLQELPTNNTTPNLSEVEMPPEKNKVFAHENPKYKVANKDIEGRGINLNNNKGYRVTTENGESVITYNGVPITTSEVPPEIMMGVLKDEQQQQQDIDLSSQTPNQFPNPVQKKDDGISKTAIKSKNAEKMRDDRIYRNARKDGPVRRNMIKSGYEPE